MVLDAAWLLTAILKYSGLAIALAGVAIFGWYFVSVNARAARSESNEIPDAAWRGPGALFGAKVLAAGFAVQILSFVLGASLPGR